MKFYSTLVFLFSILLSGNKVVIAANLNCPSFYQLSRDNSNTNGITYSPTIDFSQPGSRGILLSPQNKPDDFEIFMIGTSKALCDAQWKDDNQQNHSSGNCVSTELTDYYIQCQSKKDSQGEENWLYVSFGEYIVWFAALGEARAAFVSAPDTVNQSQVHSSSNSQSQSNLAPRIPMFISDETDDLTTFVEISCPPHTS